MKTFLTPLRVAALALVCAATTIGAFAQPETVTFTPFGPTNALSIIPRGISSSGRVVVGDIEIEAGRTQPFIWEDGVFTLDPSWGLNGHATGVSADGSIVALTLDSTPYRWTNANGFEVLPLFPDMWQSFTTGPISSDGSTIIGNGFFGGRFGAVKWTSAGIEEIVGALSARAVSADGSVIVGDKIQNPGPDPVFDPFRISFEAFRWTAAGGLVGLGSLVGDSTGSVVSGDGNVVVGNYGINPIYGSYPKALFRWTETLGFGDFYSLNQYNVPTAISFDGNVVLSTTSFYEGDDRKEAAIWREGDGRSLLYQFLRSRGLLPREGSQWRFQEAHALSPGGRFIAGNGINPYGLQQMFLVDLGPLPAPVILSPLTANAVYDSPFNYTIAATNDAVSFGAWFYWLGGLFVNDSNGVISGRPASAGTFHITVFAGNSTGYGEANLVLQVEKASAEIEIYNTTRDYTGTPRAVAIETTPPGLSTMVSYDGESTPPTEPGTYQVEAVIAEANYQGFAVGALTIIPPPTPVITSALSATATVGSAFNYSITGTNAPRSFSASPLPGGLSLNQMTGVISGQPSSAGDFVINLTASNPGGDGTATLSLQVAKGTANVEISNTNQVYTGTPRPVSIETTPVGLSTVVVYDGEPLAPSAPGTYQVSATISDTNYQGSATGTLHIFTSTLQILAQPVSLSVVEGSPASFTVIASGPGVLSYTWRKGNSANAPIVGTASTFTIPATTLADAGTYKVTVSNGTSIVSSVGVKLVVTAGSVVVAPSITAHPVNQTVTLTNSKKSVSVTFSVTATGTAPLSYQWRRNGIDVAGATASALTVQKVSLADNGAVYQVLVSNPAGSVLSNAATLTVR